MNSFTVTELKKLRCVMKQQQSIVRPGSPLLCVMMYALQEVC